MSDWYQNLQHIYLGTSRHLSILCVFVSVDNISLVVYFIASVRKLDNNLSCIDSGRHRVRWQM